MKRDTTVDALHAQDSDELGMWVFLTTETLFFGVLFFGYVILRLRFPEAFASASRHTSLGLGTMNTAVLLTSSLTMALAVEQARNGRRAATSRLLALTAALGCVFLAIKGVEYTIEYREHLFPTAGFLFSPADAEGARLFFWLYFVMTGAHALHLIIGIGLVLTLAVLLRAHATAALHPRIRIVGLYWHFVDVVWLFLFPSLYLVARS